MSNIDNLTKENLSAEDRDMILSDKVVLQELKDLKTVSESDGGKVLQKETMEKCRETLAVMIGTYEDISEMKLRTLVADFAANFNLYNTLLTADEDYREGKRNLDDKLEALIRG